MSDYRTYVTQTGFGLERDAKFNDSYVDLATLVVGDGALPDASSPSERQDLISQVRSYAVTIEKDDVDPSVWIARAEIPADDGGFTIREAGIKTADGDLYAYARQAGDYKPLLEEGQGKSYTIRLKFIPGNSDTVQIKIDPSVQFATPADLANSEAAHLAEADPHPQYQTKEDAAASASGIGDELSSANIMINTLKLQLSNNFAKMISSQPAYQMDAGTLKLAADLGVAINGDFYQYDEGAGLVLPGSMSIGTDYAIYATPDGLVVSANFTVPDGYTALTSRRVGGFHYQNGEINEFSLYDIKYCPNARNALTKANDPRGMFRIPGFGWGDIYLLNTTPDLLGTSALGATIADGASPPKKPAFWGGDGTTQYSSFTQYVAVEVLAAYGKRPPTQHEFAMLAAGSVAGYAVGTDPGTVQYDASTTSRFGAVGASGVIWQWGAEIWDRGNGSSGYDWYAGDTNGTGQIYTAGSSGVGASIFGGLWVESGHAGSRASSWDIEPWNSHLYIGARGVCDHFESC